jgi:hypothetical protein
VVLIGESPHYVGDPLACLAESSTIESCTVPSSQAVNREYQDLEESAATEADVDYLRTTEWLCQDDVCPVVMDNLLVYRDPGHLTATITEALAPRLLWELDRLP